MARLDEGPESHDVGRRCHVTLVFSDLCDYTALSEAADPEDVAAMLQAAKAAAGAVIEKHGGILNQFYGDGFLAVFGLPSGGEDDMRRAAETALELHETMRNLRSDLELPANFSMRLHSGIHSGLVFARISDARSGRYEIVGDPINTAARLCSAAGPDEILASEVTLQGVSPFFETEAVQPLRLKGKFEPLPAFRLLRRTGLATRFEARVQRGLTPFVGRGVELARLSVAFESVLAGSSRVLHLTGDVGVGKTRLIAECRRRLWSRANVYGGGCESYGHAPPLQPFLQILAQLFELEPEATREASLGKIDARLSGLDGALSEHAAALRHILSLGGPSQLGPEAVAVQNATALSALFLALSANKPLVLLLDDWHAADDASYRVLAQLLRSLAEVQRPLLVITIARFIDAVDPVAALGEVIELGPLDKVESAEAIDALLPNALEVGVADNIRERSGGNPLYLEELCQAWPYAVREGEAPSSPVPSLLHGLIQTRVERLTPELARLARAAAVIGNEFELWLLERVVAGGDVAPGLSRLAASALIYESERPGVYRYKHGVTREVVYDSVRIGERRRLHCAIAEAIEAQFDDDAALTSRCEALAYHYVGASKPSRAAKYAEMAGDKAAQSSSLDRARQHYRTTLAELAKTSGSREQRSRWLSVSRKWAAACVFSPAPEQIEVLERALLHTEELGEAQGIAHSHYWLGWIHYALGDQERALDHTERALGLVHGDARSRLAGQLLANFGQIQLAAAEPKQAIVSLQRAVSLKNEQAKGHAASSVPVGFVYALGCQGVAHAYLGDFVAGRRCIGAALDAIKGAEHAIEASLLGLLGMVQLWQGAYAECIRTTEVMSATAERVGGPYIFAMSRTFGGYARWMSGRDPQALDELRDAVDWIEQREMRLFISFGFACVAEALASDGQFEAAERYATRALERAEQMDRLGEIAARRVLARCRARQPRRAAEGKEQLEEALVIAKARGSRREIALVKLDIARASGQPNSGSAVPSDELEAARRWAAEAEGELLAMDMAHHALDAGRIARS